MQVLRAHERLDDLQLSGLKIIQDAKRFCFGTDAVLLANFAFARRNEKVMDLCTGTGIVPLLMSAKTNAAHFTGLELQPESACMARRSVKLNSLDARISIDTGDIKEAALAYGKAAFDVVTVNPPYLNAGTGGRNENGSVAAARHEIFCTLEDVLRTAAQLLRYNGRLYMVHRPHRLADVMAGLREYKLEPKRLRMVHPGRADERCKDESAKGTVRQTASTGAGNGAILFLIEASLHGKPWLTVMPPLDLSKEDGVRKF